MENLEIEFKSLITQEEYHQLIKHFKVNSFKMQTNYYFDTTEGQLRALGYGLRIRFYDEQTEITLKVPQNDGHLEVNLPLELSIADFDENFDYFADCELAPRLAKEDIDTKQLKCFAKLTTKRAEFAISEGLLALDESWYSTQHDYELELEVTDYKKGKQDFQAFLAKHQINYQPAANKIARAAKATLKIK